MQLKKSLYLGNLALNQYKNTEMSNQYHRHEKGSLLQLFSFLMTLMMIWTLSLFPLVGVSNAQANIKRVRVKPIEPLESLVKLFPNELPRKAQKPRRLTKAANSSVASEAPINDSRTVRVKSFRSDKIGSTHLYSYDANGNLHSLVKPDGAIIDYEYDSLNRLIGTSYPDGSFVEYTYGENNNRTSMTDKTGTTLYDYDDFDRLISVQFSATNPIRYEYDNAGRIISITYPDNRSVVYDYYPDDRLKSVTDSSGTTTYTYDFQSGNLKTKLLPNGVKTSYAYDNDGRLTDVIHTNANGTLISSYHYTLNANGNRIQVDEQTTQGTKATSYEYDELNRLVRVSYPDGRVVSYEYDAAGNRTKMITPEGTIEYEYDADNRLLRAGDECFLHDDNGNLIKRYSAEQTIDYTYDYENRLIKYTDGSKEVEFVYDGDGNRVAKIVDGVRINYVNDVNRLITQVLLEADEVWRTNKTYTYGLDRIRQGDSTGHRYFYLYDSPGRSVTGLTDTSGALVNRYEYDAFGETISKSGAIENVYTYNGEQNDPEAGLIFLRHRYYDPALGRFLSRDPLAGFQIAPQTINPYSYVSNNPVNLVDPNGEAIVVTALGLYMLAGGLYKGITEAVEAYQSGKPLYGRGWDATYGFLRGFGSGALGGGIKVPGVGAAVGEGINQLVLHAQGYKDDWGRKVVESGTIGFLTNKIPVAKWLRPAIKGPGSIMRLGVYKTIIGDVIGTGISKLTSLFQFNGGNLDGGLSSSSSYNRSFGVMPEWREPWRPARDAVSVGDLGGVSLSKTADLLLNVNDIAGATYDPNTGQIILYGKKNASLPEMNIDDLIVAVKSVYGGQDPGVSIDPPVVDGQFSVRYEGDTEETNFGYVMFEADRVLKTLSMGKDNITEQPVTSNVPGYKNMIQRALESVEFVEGKHSIRMWFTPKEMKVGKSEEEEGAMVFQEVSMQVLTESKFKNNVLGDPEAEAFAAHFTKHYDEFAEEFPIFKELLQLGKVVSLVKWIHDNNVPLDLSLLENHDVSLVDTPEHTPETTASSSRVVDKRERTTTFTGGVTYHSPNEYTQDQVTGEISQATINQRPDETDLKWTFQPPPTVKEVLPTDEDLTAVALSFARSRKDGNFVYSETDLSFPVEGDFDLTLTRYYDSFYDKPTEFGYGWAVVPYEIRFPQPQQSFTFGEKRTPRDAYEQISVVDRIEGREDTYTLGWMDDSERLVYEREDSGGERLMGNPDGTFTLNKKDNTAITFNSGGKLISTGDRNGNQIQYAYDGNKLVRISHSGGREIRLTYNTRGQITQASGPANRTVAYSYENGNLKTVTNSARRAITYTYDDEHRLTGAVDNKGNVLFEQSFDIYNRAENRTLGGKSPFDFDYSLKDRKTIVTDPNGNQTLRTFDEQYRLIQQINALGQKVIFDYDTDFGPSAITDGRGATTQYEYDIHGNVTAITDNEGHRSDFYYDGYDDLFGMRNPRGVETVFDYDENHNLTTIYHDATLEIDEKGFSWEYNPNNVTELNYDDAGNLVSITDQNGNTRAFEYDENGLPTSIAEAGGYTTALKYDALSRLKEISNLAGNKVALEYDDADNIQSIATAAGDVTYTYDDNNNLETVTDAEGNTTQFIHDNNNNLEQVVDAKGNVTLYTYDTFNNLTSVTLPNGSLSTYEYDELNRLIAVTTGVSESVSTPSEPDGSSASVRISMDFPPSQLTITWDEVNRDTKCNPITVERYKIYHGTSTDFKPSAENLIGEVSGTSYIGSMIGVGNPDVNYYYAIEAIDELGRSTWLANRVGEYDVYLYTTMETNYNWISLPFAIEEVRMTSKLASYIESHTAQQAKVTSISSWNAAAQGYTIYTTIPAPTGDHAVSPDGAYRVEVDIDGAYSTVLTFVGEVPQPPTFDLKTTTGTSYNWISLPVGGQRITWSSELKQHIEANSNPNTKVISISEWNAPAQSYTTFTTSPFELGNFLIKEGRAYRVEVTQETAWKP